MISTKQLRYFDALARLGNFGRAAEQCAVTQPALSMQISALEQQLGVILVERRPNGIALTAAGQEVASRAANILLDVHGLSEFAASCRAPLSTPIHLGVIPTIAPFLLPHMLPLIKERHPGLALQIRETQTDALVTELLATNLDLLIVALPIERPDVETMEVWSDRILLAVPEGSPIRSDARVSPELIQNEDLLLLEEGHCFRHQALAVCQQGPGAARMLGASSLSTLVQMVASGFGVTLLPEIGSGLEQAYGGIRLIRFADPEPTRMLGLAWRRSSPRKQEFRLVGELIRGISDNQRRAENKMGRNL